MKKNSIKYSWMFVASAALMIASSCNDKEWLSENNVQSNGLVKPNNIKDLEGMIQGCYWYMSGSGGWSDRIASSQIPRTYMADEVTLFPNSFGTSTDEQDYYNKRTMSNPTGFQSQIWNNYYNVLFLVNRVIGQCLPGKPLTTATANSLWINRIYGEGLFLRAYLNYDMVRMWGKPYGTPENNSSPAQILYKEAIYSDSVYNYFGASTVEEVYALIKSDIKLACALLPLNRVKIGNDYNGPPEYPTGRATKYAGYFLAARVFMQMHDYTTAQLYCDSLLNSNNFIPLQDPLTTWTKKVPIEDRANEVVWQYIVVGGQVGWKPPILARIYGYTQSNGTPGNRGQKVCVSDAAINLMGWNDTIQANKDLRFTQLFVAFNPGMDLRGGDYALPIIQNTRRVWANKWYRNTNQAALPLMRSPEIYLTRAWLRLKAGDAVGAASDVNVVRKRALAANYVALTSADMTENVVNNERLKEMLMEGDRLNYLQAIKKDIPTGDRGEAAARSWSNFDRAFYPQSELDRNPKLSNPTN